MSKEHNQTTTTGLQLKLHSHLKIAQSVSSLSSIIIFAVVKLLVKSIWLSFIKKFAFAVKLKVFETKFKKIGKSCCVMRWSRLGPEVGFWHLKASRNSGYNGKVSSISSASSFLWKSSVSVFCQFTGLRKFSYFIERFCIIGWKL